MLHRLFENISRLPDRQRAMTDYEGLATQYDQSIRRIDGIRRDAIDSLRLKPGDKVLDVACGTGDTLLQLAERVAPDGRVIGVDQSPTMASIAHAKVMRSTFASIVDIHVCPVEHLETDIRFDAMLMSFTHDVLQDSAAVAHLVSHLRPGAFVAVSGLRFLPWWATPINLVNAWRARRYVTSFSGMDQPWRPLLRHVPDMQIQQAYLLGSCYRALGQFNGTDPQDSPDTSTTQYQTRCKSSSG